MRTADDLYFKNGKAKKKYCVCLSTWKRAELYRLHKRDIIQCAGLQCPYYSRDCGRDNIKRYEQAKAKAQAHKERES